MPKQEDSLILAFKTECFPTLEQEKDIRQFFRLRRFYYNRSIIEIKRRFKTFDEAAHSLSRTDVMKFRKEIFRDQYPSFVKMAPAVILDTTMEDVLYALKTIRTFKRVNTMKFKTKNEENTARWNKKAFDAFSFKIGSKYISMPRLLRLKMAEPIRWGNKLRDVKQITIKELAGRFFITVICEIKKEKIKEFPQTHCGIDWGTRKYITLYDGESIKDDDLDDSKLIKLEKKFGKIRKELSKKVTNSKNYQKKLEELRKITQKMKNIRSDYVFKIVDILNNNYGSATIEDLRVSNFFCNPRGNQKQMNRKPSYLFKSRLINRFGRDDKSVYLADKNYPSTQTCSRCGYVKTKEEKLGSGKIFKCNHCGLVIDRDENAAINLFKLKDNITKADPNKY